MNINKQLDDIFNENIDDLKYFIDTNHDDVESSKASDEVMSTYKKVLVKLIDEGELKFALEYMDALKPEEKQEVFDAYQNLKK